MSIIVTFEDYFPPARYDTVPWTDVQIEEGTASIGPWTLIDTIGLSPVDADPSVPAARSFTTGQATADELWYRVIFVDGSANESQPSAAVQNVEGQTPYASSEELARILRVKVEDRLAALNRVLVVAAAEIVSEIGRDDDLVGWELALAAEVNLERAVEHWTQEQAPFGLLGLGSESGPTFTARDSWDRHAHKLAPLKGSWGLA